MNLTTGDDVKSLSELFLHFANATPQVPALISGRRRLSYSELLRQTIHIADALAAAGIKPGDRVGICIEDQPSIVIAILAAWRLRAAYVPLSPSDPVNRLNEIVADAKCSVVVHDLDQAPGLEAKCVSLEGIERDNHHSTTDWLPSSLDDIARIIYTSGTTGRPKGVALTHRAISSYCFAVSERLQIGTRQKFAVVQPFTFSGVDTMLVSALASGGELHLVDKIDAIDSSRLARYLKEAEIDYLKITPSHLRALLLGVVHPEDLMPARAIIIGGEPADWHWLRDLVRSASVAVVHHYGATETNSGVATYRVMADDCCDGHNAPLGHPLPGVTVRVLTLDLESVPSGEIGQLYVSGPNVALGYWGQAALTAARFIPDPYGPPGSRLYATGDRVSWSKEHGLRFHGRADGLVKVRGFRVELAEVEVAVSKHPEIAAAAAVMRQTPDGEDQLVCFVVPRRTGPADASAIRAYARASLPEYMVPAAFVELPRLPLDLHGKLDRNALVSADFSSATASPPIAGIENDLRELWREVLGYYPSSLTQHFMDAGGDSLAAARVLARVRTRFGVEVALRQFFELPTVAALAAVVTGGLQRKTGEPIEQVQRAGGVGLSYAQQRLWVLDKLVPEHAFYNIPLAYRLRGRLDERALKSSLWELVRRHEALRTRIEETEDLPVQLVETKGELEYELVDLADLNEAEREERVAGLARAEAKRPFELSSGRLLRSRLLKLSEEEHVLLLTTHHIASDGWSMGIITDELSKLYRSALRGEKGVLPELKLQYIDYAVWQRTWLSRERLQHQLKYWRRQLAGVAELQLPSDQPRPAVLSYRGERQEFRLSRDLVEGLRRLSRQQGATLHMILLAAFLVLLQRYSGQDDIAVGTAVAGRPRAELEQMVGFFVNTVVLRTDLSGQPSFLELLGRVREVALEAYAHQDMPFEKLVEELESKRDLSRTPLFQVSFQLTAARGELQLEGLEVEVEPTSSGTVRHDLTLDLVEGAEGLRGVALYSSDLFDASRIERLLGHYQVLLEAVLAEPTQRISELPLLTARERQQLLVEWNGTGAAYPKGQTIVELFEEHVEKRPDSVAVVCAAQSCTYRELNQRANQLAHHLCGLGVKPEQLVGLCVERSLEMVVGLLGILKAGAACLPVDPQYPPERLTYMLRDSGARLLLSLERLMDRFSESSVQAWCFDRDREQLGQAAVTKPVTRAGIDNLAYVIYTSGSTGIPKGVMVEHHGLPNIAFVQRSVFALRPGLRIAQIAAFTFDASIFEIILALCSGGTLIVATDNERSSDGLSAFLSRQAIDVIVITPSTLSTLPIGAAVGVSTALLIGEPASRSLIEDWIERVQLLNGYGPTECTIWATIGRFQIDQAPNIGRPIANTEIYVLDRWGGPVPVGVTGELCIGGQGLARGYLGRPDLTAERFVPNPFGEAGSRLYRTGDLVRYRENGDLEFLGRLDQQVKVRGYRIELGEIEAVLSEHQGVREVVVTAREESEGQKQLVAYVVGDAAGPELRAYLKQRLPEYMVPSTFVQLDRLPLTANGKVDRLALPEPEAGRPDVTGNYAGPRTPTEELLAGIWEQVLGLDRVGIHDNFFDLGGHSLLATRVVSQVRRMMEVELPFSALFESPTVAELAVVVTS